MDPIKYADSLHALATKFLAESSESTETACEKGCSYCCHQPATAFSFEAIRIAAELKRTKSKKELESLVEKMKNRVSKFGLSVKLKINDKTACPLLVDGACSVYESRPLTCRLAHSFSVKQCKKSFEGDRFKVQIPVSLELQTGISDLIGEAYKKDPNLYELCSAILAALEDDDFVNCIRDDT